MYDTATGRDGVSLGRSTTSGLKLGKGGYRDGVGLDGRGRRKESPMSEEESETGGRKVEKFLVGSPDYTSSG